MRVSFNWLSDHLDLSNYSTEDLADKLTFAGIEVLETQARGIKSDFVVVAQVLSSVQHPNAERLSVCQVDDGSGTPRQIVCGAKNFKVGDKVPLALPGAVLPGDFRIKAGKLRGEISNGMMCSGKELGLGDDHEGLLILSPEVEVGRKIDELIPSDVQFELEVTPNRPDCLSHFGIARELATLTGRTLNPWPTAKTEPAILAQATADQISVSDAAGCPFYSARRISGVKIAPSPPWLRQKLESIGLRPINNVVDITNFVLMEMGQPLHAFDAGKLSGGIQVRPAAEGEAFAALDGQSYLLNPLDLVIADAGKAVALAGVMGGSESGVSDATTDILLEAAWFQPSRVRATARRLNLSTDSSYRFERGVDAQQVLAASDLATSLILELAGGTAGPEVLAAGEAPSRTGVVAMVHSDLRRFLGADLPDEEITGILGKLGLKELAREGAGGSRWLVPGYRADLQRAVDLYGEVARVYGLDNIVERRQAPILPATAVDQRHDSTLALVRQLTGLGIYEARSIKLVSDAEAAAALSLDGVPLQAVRVRNPISDDHTTLRPGLLPGLLAAAALNRRQGQGGCRFVETGRVFMARADGSAQEVERLGLLLWGEAQDSSWHGREPRPHDWFDLKGVITSLLPNHVEVTWEKTQREGFVVAVESRENGRLLGCAGILHPAKGRQLDLDGEVLYAELDLNALLALRAASVIARDLPRYPSITRDIALEAPTELSQADIRAAFLQSKEPLLESIALFDLFKDATGQKLPADRKSLAYTLTYRHADRTMESAEVDAAHAKLVAAVKTALPVAVR